MSATNPSTKLQIERGTATEPEMKTAKLFMNGRSQAVRLPKEFRFEGTEVRIRRDPETGEVVLSEPPSLPVTGVLTGQEMLKSVDRGRFPDDFIAHRRAYAAGSSWQDLFAEWDALASPDDEPLERSHTPPIERDFF
jgi:antitoxin VapB